MAEARLGELFNALPKIGVGGNGSNQHQKAIIPCGGNNCTDESESEADEQDEKPKPKLEVAALVVVDERRCSLPHFTL